MLKRHQTSTSHSRAPVWLPGPQGSRWTWALVSLVLCPRQCHHRPRSPPQPPPGPVAFRAALSGSLCSASPSAPRTDPLTSVREAGCKHCWHVPAPWKGTRRRAAEPQRTGSAAGAALGRGSSPAAARRRQRTAGAARRSEHKPACTPGLSYLFTWKNK